MFNSLRARLTGVSVLIVSLSLIVLTVAVFLVVRSIVLDSLDASTGRLARTYADELSQWVKDKQQITGSIKLALPQQDPVPFLKAAEKAGLDLAYFVRADKSYAFTRKQPDGYDGTQRDWYKQAAAAGKPVYTPIYADAATGDLTLSFAEPVVENGKTVAVVASDMTMKSVIQKVAGIRPYEKSFAFLIDGNTGVILAHPDPALTLKPMTNLSPDLDIGLVSELAKQGGHQVVSIGGAPQMLYAAGVTGTHWLLGISIDQAEATAALHRLLLLAIVIAVACVLVAGLLMAGFVRQQLGRLVQVRDALQDIASGDGDLTRRLGESGKDELTQIASAFNLFADKISSVLVRIRAASDSVQTAATEIASGSQDLSARTEEQASSLAETAATMEEITATVRQNGDHVQEANALAATAAETTAAGNVTVGELVTTMNEINAKSQQVAEIIGVIDSIAFQTNILALNAAVEAARAGEQGRGFAVVAAEVRALAQRSAASAKEIRSLIELSVQTTAKGNQQAASASKATQEILEGIRRVTDIMREISAANREQTTGIEQINTAVTQMDDVTHQNASLVEESAAAAASLQDQANTLSELVGTFRVDDQGAGDAASDPRRGPVALLPRR
ncbi:methyl-accepting chemotaxis protein [uncultured Castellaniella sp.]|uniref:methyl-accepting chemotaxis protein n=1 Tax=uncultured Castellaniella sp. TaxID=647907 RepID=UPI002601ABB1|nr:methyl-accepting chemotaxis protein [uncultured Castellaniella sp.]